MDTIKLSFLFETKRQNISTMCPSIERYIEDFANKWFSNPPIADEIQVVLTDSINEAQKKLDLDGPSTDLIDDPYGCVVYRNNQVFLLIWIDYVLSLILPAPPLSQNNELGQKIRMDAQQVLYHEMHHIQNKYDFPILKKLPTIAITNTSEFLKSLPYHFLDCKKRSKPHSLNGGCRTG